MSAALLIGTDDEDDGSLLSFEELDCSPLYAAYAQACPVAHDRHRCLRQTRELTSERGRAGRRPLTLRSRFRYPLSSFHLAPPPLYLLYVLPSIIHLRFLVLFFSFFFFIFFFFYYGVNIYAVGVKLKKRAFGTFQIYLENNIDFPTTFI